MLNGSPFLRMLKNKIVPLDPYSLHELKVLRAMLRQEDYQGDSGWGGSSAGRLSKSASRYLPARTPPRAEGVSLK